MANAGSFKKGEKRPGQGKRGPNKATVAAKAAIEAAAEGLGGTARIVAWAKEDAANERIFWGQIYPKLLPLQVSGDSTSPLVVQHELRPQLSKSEWLSAMANDKQ